VTVLVGGYDGGYLGDAWEFGGMPCGLDGDLDGNCAADGADISLLVAAMLNSSTAPSDLYHADFNANGVIDAGDVPEFTQKLLLP
jgi:hypothetical protein